MPIVRAVTRQRSLADRASLLDPGRRPSAAAAEHDHSGQPDEQQRKACRFRHVGEHHPAVKRLHAACVAFLEEGLERLDLLRRHRDRLRQHVPQHSLREGRRGQRAVIAIAAEIRGQDCLDVEAGEQVRPRQVVKEVRERGNAAATTPVRCFSSRD